MIGFLFGKVITKSNNNVVLLTTSGVGYKVFLSSRDLEKIMIDSDLECFVHTHVREDQISLFGFSAKQDLDIFELLITVSGVGPKTAMNIFSVGSGGEIEREIGRQNKMFFKGVTGLGTKTIEKIFIELKNRVNSQQLTVGSGQLDTNMEEAMSALQNLGYQKYEIFDFFKRNPGIDSEKVEMIVKRFLKK